MGVLDRYVDKIPAPFDIETLLDPDISKFENANYSGHLIYKYFPTGRRSFFERPQVRFSQRQVLNDPFEMTKRWKQVSTDGLRRYLKEHMSIALPQIFSDANLLAEAVTEQLTSNGISLSPLQRRQVEELLKSDMGKTFLSNQLVTAQMLSGLAVDYVFAKLETEFDRIVSELVSQFGVLSLTEDPVNQLMWAHYASVGTGFVVGFDAHHKFFHAKSDVNKNVLRKVWYTDERTQNFWSNPYFLFLVKNNDWAYEREWRVLKDLTECDEQKAVAGARPVCLCNVPPEAIKAVHFGYAYDAVHLQHDIAALRAFGCSTETYTVQVNRDSGQLESRVVR